MGVRVLWIIDCLSGNPNSADMYVLIALQRGSRTCHNEDQSHVLCHIIHIA
jgi:hypothetical protein